MAQNTSIEWTDKSWNFLRGCSRVSEGCRNCYAEKIAARFSDPGQPYHGIAKRREFVGDLRSNWTGEISFHEKILLEPLKWRKPCRVFVNSMSDLFHEKVRDEWLDKAFAVMALTPQHTYQVLTKRPERMREYLSAETLSLGAKGQICRNAFERIVCAANVLIRANDPRQDRAIEWPLKNVWAGVSVEDQKTADERIPLLLETPAAVRWISAEPLLGPVDLTAYLQWTCHSCGKSAGPAPADLGFQLNTVDKRCPSCECGAFYLKPSGWPQLTWIVVGGESGPNARPFDIQWARDIIAQCKAADVPVFVKQVGAKPVQKCNQCGRMVGNCLGGMVDACGPTHALLAREAFIKDPKGGKPEEWPEDLRIREMPSLET